MRSSSARKIANMRQLLDTLTHGSMGPYAVAALLHISHSAARDYLADLKRAGVTEADPDCRAHYRLRADATLVHRFLAALATRSAARRVSMRRSSSRHCVNPGQTFLHVMTDDVCFPLVLNQLPARRDPLVAALFGTDGLRKCS